MLQFMHMLRKSHRVGTLGSSSNSRSPDSRSVDDVVTAAAKHVGLAESSKVTKTLKEHGVHWAWQLEHADVNDWVDFGVSKGLKMAIKAELCMAQTDPMHASSPAPSAEEMPEKLRRFLLLPGPDGTQPRSLASFSGLFLSLVTGAPEDRQQLTLAVCELLALLSGLLLPIPFEMLRHQSEVALDFGWMLPPLLEDAMDALAAYCILASAFTVFIGVALAMAVASGGSHSSLDFYVAVVPLVGALFGTFMMGTLLPIFILLFWQLFTAAASPYPLLGALTAFWLLATFLDTLFFGFMIDAMPLEVYHTPRWFRLLVSPFLPHRAKELRDKQLEPRAKMRAAELRKRVDIFASGDLDS